MKWLVDKFLSLGWRVIRRGIYRVMETIAFDLRHLTMKNTQIQQGHLRQFYRSLKVQDLPPVMDTGFRVFSQVDEDGILHYIFSVIGTTSKVCAELSFGSPYGSNTTNLIVNDGWLGILICRKQREVKETDHYFAGNADVLYKPKVYQRWLTAENVNQVLLNGLKDLSMGNLQIDLLSIDVDGMDYWLWKALDCSPRVVVIEYNYVLGDRPMVVPYAQDFDRNDKHVYYYGASLTTLVKLAKDKGYRLVGCNRLNFNAFFVRNDIDKGLPEIPFYVGLSHPHVLENCHERYEAIENYEWEVV